MNLLYTDETNFDPKKSDFFVYAGVVIPNQTASALSAAIDTLRRIHGYRPGDLLKFNTVERPSHISSQTCTQIKQQLLIEAARCNVKLIASVISHRIARSPEEARMKEINRISLHFNYHLRLQNEYGLVLLDSFKDNVLTKFLREKFDTGVVGLPYGSYRLKRILGFHLASIGTSNFCSVVDVVLGSLRYAINGCADPAKRQTAQTLLNCISPLAIRDANGRVMEMSFFFSPRRIKVAAYLQEYQQLHAFLAQNGFQCAQQPGN